MSGVLEDLIEKVDAILAILNDKPAPAKDEDEDETPKKRTRTPNKKPAVDIAAVKEKMKEVLDQQGRKTGLKLLKDFDAEKLGDLEESQYEDFIKACDEALEEAD